MEPERLPEDLDQAYVLRPLLGSQLTHISYGRILKRLLSPEARPSSRSASVRNLLGWLACAKRPLKWYEIQGIVAIDLEEGAISAKHRFLEDCKDLCASLVELGSDQIVSLVHATTKM